ncbi:hypothetical protein KEM54_006523 [Ascosphaera aggregata]|nr:hypothetical protein KEM54_006523 [Ascosphaera aggregata]
MASDTTFHLLTKNEQSLLVDAMLCVPGGLTNVKVDYDKLAEVRGLKNRASATATWCGLRKKMASFTETTLEGGKVDDSCGNGGPLTPRKSAPTTPRRVTKNTNKIGKKKDGENVKKEAAALLASDIELSPVKKKFIDVT